MSVPGATLATGPVTVQPPAPGPPARITCRLSGRDALLTVTGDVHRPDVVRVEIMIHALRAAGAACLVVDLLGAGGCDRALTGALHRQRDRQVAMGGWLVVDRAPVPVDDGLDLPLAQIFQIYRDATAPRVPAPRTG